MFVISLRTRAVTSPRQTEWTSTDPHRASGRGAQPVLRPRLHRHRRCKLPRKTRWSISMQPNSRASMSTKPT
jgi:hypothetical protein